MALWMEMSNDYENVWNMAAQIIRQSRFSVVYGMRAVCTRARVYLDLFACGFVECGALILAPISIVIRLQKYENKNIYMPHSILSHTDFSSFSLLLLLLFMNERGCHIMIAAMTIAWY